MSRGYLVGEIAWHRLVNKTLEDFDWKENQYLETLIKVMVEKERWDKGLGLIGWVGVGKTHLLVALYKERMWRAIYERSQLPGFITFYDLVEEWQKRDGKELVKEIIRSKEIWFVDDLWSGGMGDIEREVLRHLVFRCYDTGKILCFSANIPLDQWVGVDERVIDRIKEMCIVTDVKGFSRRDLV